MGTISQKLAKVSQTKENIAAAIQDRGGTVPSAFKDYPDAITDLSKYDFVDSDVVFYNVSGDIVATYTSAQAMALTAMPNPLKIDPDMPDSGWVGSHATTWNMDLPKLKRIVSAYGKAVVGGYYTTDMFEHPQFELVFDIADPTYKTITLAISVAPGVSVTAFSVDEYDYERYDNDWQPFEIFYNTEDDYEEHWFVKEFDISSSATVGIQFYSSGFDDAGMKLEYKLFPDDGWHGGSPTANAARSALKTAYIFPGYVTEIGDEAFAGCYNLSKLVFIEDDYRHCTLARIGQFAFSECTNLKQVTVVADKIEQNAFDSCHSLRFVSMAEADDIRTSIGNEAFVSANSLSRVCIPYATDYGENAFAWSGVRSFEIPTTVTGMGDDAFLCCPRLRTLDFYAQTSAVPYGIAQDAVSLESVNIYSDTVKRIEAGVFEGCSSLSSVYLPPGVTAIEEFAFSWCSSLKEIELPEDLVILENDDPLAGLGAFGESSLSHVDLPYSLSAISKGTFEFTPLTELWFPPSVLHIGAYAFNSSSIKTFDFSDAIAVPVLDNDNAFGYTPYDMKILVPSNLYNAWISATQWSNIASKIEAV